MPIQIQNEIFNLASEQNIVKMRANQLASEKSSNEKKLALSLKMMMKSFEKVHGPILESYPILEKAVAPSLMLIQSKTAFASSVAILTSEQSETEELLSKVTLYREQIKEIDDVLLENESILNKLMPLLEMEIEFKSLNIEGKIDIEEKDGFFAKTFKTKGFKAKKLMTSMANILMKVLEEHPKCSHWVKPDSLPNASLIIESIKENQIESLKQLKIDKITFIESARKEFDNSMSNEIVLGDSLLDTVVSDLILNLSLSKDIKFLSNIHDGKDSRLAEELAIENHSIQSRIDTENSVIAKLDLEIQERKDRISEFFSI